MKKLVLMIFFSVVIISCKNRELEVEGNHYEYFVPNEKRNYSVELPHYMREIAYFIGSEDIKESQVIALDNNGAFLNIEVREKSKLSMETYIYNDLRNNLQKIHVLERNRIYLDDYIGIQLSILFDNEIRKNLIYFENRNYIFKIDYQAPYNNYATYLDDISYILKSLKIK